MSSATDVLLDFIRHLTTAAATASLYHLEHQQVVHLSQQTKAQLDILLQQKPEFSLMLIENRLIFDEQPLEAHFAVTKLSRFLQQQKIAHLTFKQGISEQELLRLIELLSQKGDLTEKIEASEHLRIGQVEVHNNEGEDSETEHFLSLEEIQHEEIDRFHEIYEAIQAGKRIHVRGLNEIVHSFIQAFSEQGTALLALSPLRKLDEYTFTHSTNVCILNIGQAKMLGIDGQLLYDIGISAMLHDIGKLFVPVEILQKEGSLDDDEWALMQQHPQLGAEYLVNTPGIPRLAITTAYEHHMRYNNSGYPKVGKNWSQHICSQMTTISDFFDALRTHRSYRAGMDFDKVANIMREESGTTLHPQLTRNFLSCIRQLDQQLG